MDLGSVGADLLSSGRGGKESGKERSHLKKMKGYLARSKRYRWLRPILCPASSTTTVIVVGFSTLAVHSG